MLFYQTLAFSIHGNIKDHKKIINLKYQPQHGIKNFNYLMDHILCPIFNTILSILSKNMKQSLIIH